MSTSAVAMLKLLRNRHLSSSKKFLRKENTGETDNLSFVAIFQKESTSNVTYLPRNAAGAGCEKHSTSGVT